LIGRRVGPYEITAKLGAGGMGEVYRATDTKLKREVAIKVLPSAFTADPERLARFEREAQLLAQLHHPNIASIFGLEECGGVRALVMELVEGPTLAERLEAGPLPWGECLSLAVQLARALEAAHEKGIVHRDLKPQNIKVSAEGQIKVLDFGLAKALDPAVGSSAAAGFAGSPAAMDSPTLTAVHGTELGVILGTAAYMAPEQARGKAVDKRADIWAFGVVFYEMLVGRRLFDGDSVADTLARVLEREIDFAALPPFVPSSIRSLLRRCLERNPKNRLRDIGDARLVIEEAMAAPAESAASFAAAPPRALTRWMRAAPWALAAAALALAGWAIASRSAGRRSSEAPQLTRLEISLPSGVEAASGIAGGFAIAPDGRSIAMIGVRDGQRRLYVRRLDRPAATEITASSGVNSAAFSPDGSAVAFVPGSAEVTRLTLADQQRTVVVSGADLSSTIGWGQSGIYFHRNGALWMVPAQGGEPRQLVELDAARGEVQHSDPLEIPGTGSVIFTSMSSTADSGRIESVALAGGARSVIIERGSTPVWSPTGHLLFERDGMVWAAAFDPAKGAVAGDPTPVMKSGEVGALRFGGLGFRLSANGTLVYMPPDFAESRIASVSRDGVERALELPTGPYASPRISPDGKRLVVERSSSTIEVLELARGMRTQLTTAAFGSSFPIWTADGRRVVCRRFNLPHWIAADASGRSDRIPGCAINDYPTAPGPDPDSVLTVRIQAGTGGDLMLVSISGSFPPKTLLATPAYEGGPQLSPDRKWLVYQSNATGKPEIFIRRYPALDRAWQVSEGGGVQTRWSMDGREIYYRSGQRMMAATFDGAGAEPLLGRPKDLFADEYDFGQGLSIPNYDVTPDGRFLVLRRTPSGGRFHVVLGWAAELERLVASGGVR
jgi:Tol biopolymer transport system component